uniref:GDSL-type esterase/lipase family protein n=1 Tax=uncultured Draconibacterium sp. TaxID=1573823 RepID=UPI003216E49D
MKINSVTFFLILGLIIIGQQAVGQSIYYERRVSLFEKLPINSNDIVFLGNSITDGAEWAELFNQCNIKNRGISGDIIQGIIDRLDPIVKGKPAKLFLLIGINDISRDIPQDSVVNNIAQIIDRFQKESGNTGIYLQSILPVNDNYSNFKKHVVHWAMIPEINRKLKDLAASRNITYLDLFSHFTDETGFKLNKNYTNDGLHLTGSGYVRWAELIEGYVKE